MLLFIEDVSRRGLAALVSRTVKLFERRKLRGSRK